MHFRTKRRNSCHTKAIVGAIELSDMELLLNLRLGETASKIEE